VIILLLVIAAFISLACSAFCSGTETAFLSVGRERVLHLAREGGRKAQKVQRAISDMGRTTITLLIGNNIANVSYSAATAALSDSALWAFFAAFLILYVSEFMPKLLFAARPLRRTLMIADAYEFVSRVLSPLTFVAMKLTDVFIPRRESKYRLTIADLTRILEDRKDGVCISDFESALISRIIVLRAKNQPITPEAIMAALK
jgi:CBS domain containing-hemolysin-like protein